MEGWCASPCLHPQISFLLIGEQFSVNAFRTVVRPCSEHFPQSFRVIVSLSVNGDFDGSHIPISSDDFLALS